MKDKLKILENLLKNHDWFHQYSDDFGVYESGQEESGHDFIKFLYSKDSKGQS